MKLKHPQILYGIFMLCVSTATLSADVIKSGVEVFSTHTHIYIQTSQAVKTQADLLENPSRIVLDVEGLRINAALQPLIKHSWQGHARITKLRMSQFRPNTLRIVLDLKKPARFELTPSSESNQRIAFDIYPAQSNALPKSQMAPAEGENQTAQDKTSPNKTSSNSAGAQITLEREPIFDSDSMEDEGAIQAEEDF